MTRAQLLALQRQAPETIWLQVIGVDRSEVGIREMDVPLKDVLHSGEVSWCTDQISDTDVLYRRVLKPRRKRVA